MPQLPTTAAAINADRVARGSEKPLQLAIVFRTAYAVRHGGVLR